MQRAIIDHLCPVSADQTTIYALDVPGAGGAHHCYSVSHPFGPGGARTGFFVHFQKGPVKEAGVNGTTVEALLAICADRLRCFQAGPCPCEENADALRQVEGALGALHRRTHQRARRGVEGTSEA